MALQGLQVRTGVSRARSPSFASTSQLHASGLPFAPSARSSTSPWHASGLPFAPSFRSLCRVRAGVAMEVALFLVRKYKSSGAGDVRLLTATPPSPPPGEMPNLCGKRGAGNHARADTV